MALQELKQQVLELPMPDRSDPGECDQRHWELILTDLLNTKESLSQEMETSTTMHTIQIKSHVDNDGLLHIPLSDLKDTDVEVILVYQPAATPAKRQWSSEFLSTFGAWQGEPLVRAPQEEASEREPF